MSELHTLIHIIKLELKHREMTYADVAKALDLSEASVKRMFSTQDFNLSRLEDLLNVMKLSILDLFELMRQYKQPIKQLTEAQEKELVANKKLLLVTLCILNHWQYEDIMHYYEFDDHELMQMLAQLDRLKIIELNIGTRFKRLVDAKFQWISNGPIQQFYQKHIQQDFLQSSFRSPQDLLLVRSGMVSEQDNKALQELLITTADKFIQQCDAAKNMSLDKQQGTALVIAMRPWAPKIFDVFRRTDVAC